MCLYVRVRKYMRTCVRACVLVCACACACAWVCLHPCVGIAYIAVTTTKKMKARRKVKYMLYILAATCPGLFDIFKLENKRCVLRQWLRVLVSPPGLKNVYCAAWVRSVWLWRYSGIDGQFIDSRNRPREDARLTDLVFTDTLVVRPPGGYLALKITVMVQREV